MWEDETLQELHKQNEEQSHKEKTSKKTDANLVLWVQLCLCAVLAAALLAAKKLDMPFYPLLRSKIYAEMQAEAWYRPGEERKLLQFTQESTDALKNAVSQIAACFESEPIGEEAKQASGKARPRHKQTAPYGYSDELWQQNTAMEFPLLDAACEVSSGYGWRTNPLTGAENDYHGGVDLAAATGTLICAAKAGVVRVAGTHKSYGNYLRILHTDGTETLYAHMQYLFVRSGQRVQAKQCLGTVGQTGDATGPHLHFEILYQGVRYDPTAVTQQAEKSD